MTQPVLAKKSVLIAVLTVVQAVVPAIITVASLYATIIAFGEKFDRSSVPTVDRGGAVASSWCSRRAKSRRN